MRNGLNGLRRCSAWTLLAAAGAYPIAAQELHRIPHQVACAGCSIVSERLFSFGKETDSVLPDASGPLAIDSRGNVFAAASKRSTVAVYDGRGILQRTIGVKGNGPGEFSGSGVNLIVIGGGDTLFVWDTRNRMIVFSPSTFRHVRTVPLAGRLRHAQALPNGNLLVGALFPASDNPRVPFHEITSTGSHVRWIGSLKSGTPTGLSDMVKPFVYSPATRSIWRGGARYSVEQILADGAWGTALEVVGVPWMADKAMNSLDTVVGGRSMRIVLADAAVSLAGADAEGLLWFNGYWFSSPFTPQMLAAGKEPAYHHRLEVVDPGTRQLLVSQPFETVISLFPGSNLAWSTSTHPAGFRTFTVWRIALVRR